MYKSQQLTRKIGFLVFEDFQILDLTGPLAVFEAANTISGKLNYVLHTVSLKGGSILSSSGLSVIAESAEDYSFDTLVIAGGVGAFEIARNSSHQYLVQSFAANVRRMTSVCTGAFILAGSGLLDNRRATTHWRFSDLLSQSFPNIKIEPDSIFVKDGPVWSAAGVTAGIDLALALVEDDHDLSLARSIAQELVIYHRRQGGQPQFSAMLKLEPSSDRIRAVLTYIKEHLAEPLSISTLAEFSFLSERQFGRIFRAETGETPAKAIERLRAEAAYTLLEGSLEPVEVIGQVVGFNDPERMRRAFIRLYGQPPQAIRRIARRK